MKRNLKELFRIAKWLLINDDCALVLSCLMFNSYSQNKLNFVIWTTAPTDLGFTFVQGIYDQMWCTICIAQFL
jgi:hypothetical protein